MEALTWNRLTEPERLRTIERVYPAMDRCRAEELAKLPFNFQPLSVRLAKEIK